MGKKETKKGSNDDDTIAPPMNDDGLPREENKNNDGEDNQEEMEAETEEEGEGQKGDVDDGTTGGKNKMTWILRGGVRKGYPRSN